MTAPEPARHALYLEVLGKGGLWGLGYDYRITKRLRVGAVASLTMLDGDRLLSFTPYLAASLVTRGHHSWYVDGGPQLVDYTAPSTVPEWHGTGSTGIGFEVSTGYEYRNHVLVRVFGMATAGAHGVAPWLGASFGWSW